MTHRALDAVRELAQQFWVDSVRCSTSAGSGHPTSSMSVAPVMAVFLDRHFRYGWERPDGPANDHLIFSKGHASPLLYSMFKDAGAITDDELMTGYRRFGRPHHRSRPADRRYPTSLSCLQPHVYCGERGGSCGWPDEAEGQGSGSGLAGCQPSCRLPTAS